MYKALKSFTTADYQIQLGQILEDDFDTQDVIQEFMDTSYIEEYDNTIEIAENGVYDVEDYANANVNVPAPTPNLQNKTITITENGTNTITADTGYDGLDEVEITTNVSGGNAYPPNWLGIGYSETPESVITGFNYAKQIKDNWDNDITSMNNMFESDSDLKYFPLVDTSKVQTLYRTFYGSRLEKLPKLDFSSVINLNYTFYSCQNLETFPEVDTRNVGFISNAFTNCEKLKNFPILDTSKCTSLSGFGNCPSLSDESLNNILYMCAHSAVTTGSNKKLRTIGLSQAQATICQGLSNYQAFLDAGWTTGY